MGNNDYQSLMARLQNLGEVIELDMFAVRHQALVNILELHKPEDSSWGSNCAGCSHDLCYEVWPCPTIQAIYKAEIKNYNSVDN